MKREKTNLMHRVASLMLAVVMVLSVIVVMPKDVKAEVAKTLPSNGGSLTITDEECYIVSREATVITYTAPKDGSLQLTFSNATRITGSYNGVSVDGYAWGDVTLCNTSMTPLSAVFTYYTDDTRAGFYSEIYGVKKGTTYKIRVLSAGGVTINAKFTQIKSNLMKNSKKGKAINLKKKKQTTGVIQAGTTNTHWYKFKLTKAKKLNVGITPKLTGSVKITITGPGVKKGTFQVDCRYTAGSSYYLGSWGIRRAFTTSGKVKPGTYYIQVKPISRTCGGSYKINWK